MKFNFALHEKEKKEVDKLFSQEKRENIQLSVLYTRRLKGATIKAIISLEKSDSKKES